MIALSAASRTASENSPRQLGRTLTSLTRTGFYDEASLLDAVAEITPTRFNAFVERVLDSALVVCICLATTMKRLPTTWRKPCSALPEERAGATEYARERVYAPVLADAG